MAYHARTFDRKASQLYLAVDRRGKATLRERARFKLHVYLLSYLAVSLSFARLKPRVHHDIEENVTNVII